MADKTDWDSFLGPEPATGGTDWDKFLTPQGEQISGQQALALQRRPTAIELNALKAGTGGLLGPWAPTWAKPEPVPGGPLTAEEKWKAGVLSAMPVVAG